MKVKEAFAYEGVKNGHALFFSAFDMFWIFKVNPKFFKSIFSG